MVNVVLNRYKNLRHIGCLHSAGKGRIIMEYTFTAANFEEEVLQSELPVLVDFYADWCGPCKMVAPILEELSKEYAGKIYIYKVNVDKEPELARDFGIQSIPTIWFVPMKGEPQVNMGALSKEQLKGYIDKVLLKQ